MGKGEGKILAEKYKIQSFPALLFLDKKGEIQHMLIGFCPPDKFIREGMRAMDVKHCLREMMKRFEKGDRTLDFLADYVTVLRNANRKETHEIAKLYVEKTGMKQRFEAGERDINFMEEYAKVLEVARVSEYLYAFAPEYLSLLPIEQIATTRNWEWVQSYCNLRFSEAIRKVADRPTYFAEIAGGIEAVNYLVMETLRQEMYYYLSGLDDSRIVRDKQELEKFLECLRRIDTSVASECFAVLMGLKYVMEKDYEGLLDNTRRILKYNVLPAYLANTYFLAYWQTLENCSDVQYVNDGLYMLEQYVRGRVQVVQEEGPEQLAQLERLKQRLVKYAAGLIDNELK